MRVDDWMMGDYTFDNLPEKYEEASLLTAKQERQLIAKAQGGDLKAVEKLVKANLGLVRQVTIKYSAAAHRHSMPLVDCLQWGVVGLLEAIKRFQLGKGDRFSTYAKYWIRREILKAISDSSRAIRLPNWLIAALQKIEAAQEKVRQLGRKPTTKELAEFTDQSKDRIAELLVIAHNTDAISLDQIVDDNGMPLLELIASRDSDPADDCALAELRRYLEKALAKLDARSQDIIRMRWGLNDGVSRTLKEVGEYFGIRRERVRQIEQRAFARIRKSNPELLALVTGFDD